MNLKRRNIIAILAVVQFIYHEAEASRIQQLVPKLKFDKSKIEKSTVNNHKKTVVCIVDSWSYWRVEESSFAVTDVDPTLCSQLVYRIVGINNETFSLKFEKELPINKDWFNKAVALSKDHPHLKVLFSVGGWSEGSWTFSKIAADYKKREVFVESVLRTIEDYGFYGVDIAWEYPGWKTRGGTSSDKANLPLLLSDLRTSLGNKYLLTLTVDGYPPRAVEAYDIKAIVKFVDQINVRSFDYSGGWNSMAYHHSALIDNERDRQSVSKTVQFYLEGGCPPEKMILGVPFYGRTFSLLNSEPGAGQDLLVVSGLQQASKGSFGGDWVDDDLLMGFHEICHKLLNDRNNEWKTYSDQVCLVPFARNGTQWVSFDDIESIEAKVEFAMRHGLKGVMAWAIDTDDFKGTACKRDDDKYDEPATYPLLRTINYKLYESMDKNGTGIEGRSNTETVNMNHRNHKQNQSQRDSSSKTCLSSASLVVVYFFLFMHVKVIGSSF